MTLPAYPSPISLSSLQNEFGGSNPISLSEYYATKSRININISYMTDVTYYGDGGSNVTSMIFYTNGVVQSVRAGFSSTWADVDPSSIGVYTITVYNVTLSTYVFTDATLDVNRSVSVSVGIRTTSSKTNYYNITIKDPSGTVVGTATNIGLNVSYDGAVNSVSSRAYMPGSLKPAGDFIPGDSLLLLSDDRQGSKFGEVISNRLTDDAKLITLISESGIKLTCSIQTPLTLENGDYIFVSEALGHKLPVQDIRGFRWEYIVGLIDAGVGQVATIYCDDQCYAAGDENGKYIWTHNMAAAKQ